MAANPSGAVGPTGFGLTPDDDAAFAAALICASMLSIPEIFSIAITPVSQRKNSCAAFFKPNGNKPRTTNVANVPGAQPLQQQPVLRSVSALGPVRAQKSKDRKSTRLNSSH